ncbi:hypothetical protein K503DRAFT_290660 [Rhizopogon vinicolor AM-OR11-026]|uniref:Uncharacterized protein n=1 Tax=Rhizopogon vinicolor AM-OR11-026 TaxID=1314800 RepID=A0A1B7MVC6_9AGAM|nr:hypothetical protein K503DRAFT_290660 [Rhizopogon vinicolor AM-OR11-026]
MPIQADEEIFATRYAHSDFDRYTLVNSRPAVEQFFRWKASMQARPKPVLVGMVLQAKSHGFQRRKYFQPRYPIESIPEDTLVHLRAVARSTFPQFTQLLDRSQRFSLLLDDELTPSEGTGYARTFSCRIVTVDGQPLSDNAPKRFCVKLFNDSAASIPSHTEYHSLTFWSQTFYTAEDMIHNEIGFTLEECGILIEYVTLSDTKLEEQSEVAQIAFIESARHALRVLQYADISQLDWSSEQWISTPSPCHTTSNSTLTCVLIDFALTAQGDRYKDGYKEDDYGGMADMLDEARIPADLIRKWFGPREEWDFFRASYVMEQSVR